MLVNRLCTCGSLVAPVVLFKVCGIIAISKIEFFQLFGIEGVKKNQKIIIKKKQTI